MKNSCSLFSFDYFSASLQFEEMNAELEENKELAQNRHCELEKLRQDFDEVTAQNEKLKVGDTSLMGSKTRPLLTNSCV